MFSCKNDAADTLIFTAKEDNTKIRFDIVTRPSSGEKQLDNPISLKYRVNTDDFRDYMWKVDGEERSSFSTGPAEGVELILRQGDRVYFKGNNETLSNNSAALNFKSDKKVEVQGSVMNLLNDKSTIPSEYCFYYLFGKCKNLLNAPTLPSTSLTPHCYESMFEECTSLIQAPVLPATELKDSCYMSMFEGCTSLTVAPNLPSKSLAEYCYNQMFLGCTSLTTTPDLPAEELKDLCYLSMFEDCTSLTKAPESLGNVVAPYCCKKMFSGCENLTAPPRLKAKSLVDNCYDYMFSGCSKINEIYCYADNFINNDPSASTYEWLKDVASNGTFYCANPNWPDGDSGIPSGWTEKTI